MLYCLLENDQHYGHYCIYYFPIAIRIKKQQAKDLLHPITISQTFSTKSHHIYLCSKCYSKYGFAACVFQSLLNYLLCDNHAEMGNTINMSLLKSCELLCMLILFEVREIHHVKRLEYAYCQRRTLGSQLKPCSHGESFSWTKILKSQMR